jgi:DASH complex subunit DAD1
MDSVLVNLNQLNRSLESVIAVGNEFGSVEALWSIFETVMGPDQGQQAHQGQGRSSATGEGAESRGEETDAGDGASGDDGRRS